MKEANANPDIELIVGALIMDNPDKVKAAMVTESLSGWFIGQAMKQTGGRLNPYDVQCKVKEVLQFLRDNGYGE